jgi:hypothetical protein
LVVVVRLGVWGSGFGLFWMLILDGIGFTHPSNEVEAPLLAVRVHRLSLSDISSIFSISSTHEFSTTTTKPIEM